MVPSTVFGLLISPRSSEVTKLRYTITIFMWRCGNRKGRLTTKRDVGNIVSTFWRLIACLTPGPSRSQVQADLAPGPSRSYSWS